MSLAVDIPVGCKTCLVF